MRGSLILLGAILFLLVNSSEVFGECPEDNEGEAVHLPHESDCTLFYKCDWGTPVLQECPDGLHFNPTLQVCDWPEDAGCVSGSNGNSDDGEDAGNDGEEGNTTDSGNDDSTVVGECPADNDGEAVHLPHESDCTLFYKCDWGTPVLQECPDGLHFNPTLQVCDWPEDAGCVSGSNGNSDDGEDAGNDGEDGNTTDSGNDDSNAVGECPADNDGEAVHLPHESDCTLFYKCDWGTPVLQECPDGLHFNPTLQVCDWPEDAGCVSGSNGNSDDGEDAGNDDDDGNTTDNGNDDSNAVGECPADNDGEAVHLPHESDCTLFYKCDWGTPVLQECPDGLHFNPTLQVCDWPEDAGCVSGSDGNSDDGEDAGNDGDDGNTTDSGNDDSNTVGECPADNDGEAVHLPHESDCTLFYKCDWGTPVLQECPDGLHFNPTLQVCDWPEDAGCVSGSDGNSDDGEDAGNDDDDGNTTDSGNDDSNAVGECPADNDGEAVHLPHESDCTLFYKCDWGTPVLQECPDGLHFNPTLQVCDWPEDAGCVSGSNGNSDDGEDAGDDGEDGNTTDSGNDDSNAVGECPADNDGEAVHLPHESDCTLFYKCDWGTPVLQECPDGLHFNPTLQVCDWPEDAGCVSGSDGNSDDGEDGGNDGDDGNTTDSGNDDSNAVGECPADNDGETVHLPHESDCTLFYKCDWGTPVLQECPDGLHFNPTLQVCDWPEDAGCVNGSDGNSDDGEDGGNDGDDGNTTDSGNDDSTVVGDCPADNDGEAVHLPHESDCTLFYKCDWGTPVLQECPDGLHFNPTLQVCDWPEDAGCVSGSDGNSDDGEDGGNDGDDGNTTDSGNDDSNAVGECPADNDGEAVHLPHESDCTLFYKCDWGTPVLQECPDGLHFNPTLQVCDWPEDAGCVSGSDGNSDDGDDGGNDGDDGNTTDSGNDDSNAVGECPADNDGEAVHLPHESDCTLFYKCDWGTPVLQECPDGLHFNPTLQVCDWPEDAGCVSGSDGNSDDGDDGNTTDSGNDDSNAVGECPADNDGEAVHLPHESDCTLFYKCDWGTPVLQECPDGLHFNPTLQVCDWPEDAGCVSGSDGNSDDGDDGNTTDSGNDGSNTVGECPADNDGEAVHLPHESDCTLFYKCDWGTPVLQECPDGLHFNPTLQVCDWPEDAGCVSGSDGNSDDGEDGGNDGDDGNTTESENGGDDGESESDGNNAVGECPADNDGDAVHLPHESDCTLFYKCDWGTPVLQECPDGLHFNPTLQVCDWPEDAGCVSGSDGNSDDGEDGGNHGDDGNTTDSGNDDSNAVGECPADNDGEAVHLPHESDCTLFYKCDWGTPVLQECPDGLHFNPTLQVCDWPEDAGCVSGSDGNSDDGDDGGNDGDDGNTTDSGNDDSDAVGECSADNDGEAVHLPHESDCTLFYKCDWGTPVLQECPDGLHFNPTLQVCDWPEDAGCVSGSDGNSDDGDDGNTTDSGNDDSNAVGECPADNDGEAVHLPHESDCTLFYKCDWGTPVLQECPDGLHFNPTLQVCDWPEDAGCVSGSDGNSDDGEDGGNDGDDGNTTDSGNDDSNKVGECPADNDGEAVHLPHESDCTLFYKCDWGTPVLQECPDGLHFNPTLQVCDWPEDAGCVSGSDGNSDDGEDGGNDGDDGNTTESENGGDDGESESDGNNAVGECPADNDGDVVHLPHESDCTLFYKCDWGTPVLEECPDGLHFNPTLQVCDWPEDAGCVSGSDGNSDDDEQGINDGDDGNDNDDGSTGDAGNDDGENVEDDSDGENGEATENEGDGEDNNDDSNGGSGFCNSVSCPAENEEYVTFIPNDNDCTRFCKCNWGLAYEYVCPDGLYFNPTLNVCDWPEDSGCVM